MIERATKAEAMSRSPSPVVVWRRMILEAEGLSWKARLMALVLMDHMNGDGASCFPSLTTLSRESGCARSTVCAGLDELDRADYISRRRGWSEDGRNSLPRY